MRKVIMIIAALAILAGCGTKQNNDAGNIPELPITAEIVPNTTEMVPDTTEQKKTTGQNPAEELVTEPQESETTLSEQEFQRMQDDIYILARLAMAEAEGEGLFGKSAVVRVALNRVQSTEFPDAEVKYDSACGTYEIQKEDGGTIYVPLSHIENIKAEREVTNAGN